jgi:hypothetical protein
MHKLTVSMLILTLLIAAAAQAASPPPSRTLTIEAIAAINSHEQILGLASTKSAELASLLEQATDAASARRIRPAAERVYLECQLINIRVTMLPQPDMGNVFALAGPARDFKRNRERLMSEMERIGESPVLTAELRPVIESHTRTTRRGQAARAGALLSALQTIRSQTELYRLQHNDQYPDFSQHGWKQFTSRTSADGEPVRKGGFGPYLQAEPRNPLNKFSAVYVAKETPEPGFKVPSNSYGWIWDQSEGRMHAVDANGVLLDESAVADIH